jgi:hypothetical protein
MVTIDTAIALALQQFKVHKLSLGYDFNQTGLSGNISIFAFRNYNLDWKFKTQTLHPEGINKKA